MKIEIDGVAKSVSEWARHPECRVTRQMLAKRWRNGIRSRAELFARGNPARVKKAYRNADWYDDPHGVGDLLRRAWR